MKPKRLAELAVLTAVSLIIFIIELQIPNPFPIPGVKLGLANIITVYAVYHYTGQMAAALLVTQTLGLIAYYPFLLVSGCLAGLFTGLCAQLLIPRIRKIKK